MRTTVATEPPLPAAPPPTPPTRLRATLYRLGLVVARNPKRVVALWLVVFVAAVALASALGGKTADDYDIGGTPSLAATQALREHFSQVAGADTRVLVTSHSTLDPAVLASVSAGLSEIPSVGAVAPPRISTDGDTALIALTYDIPVTSIDVPAALDDLEKAAAPADEAGYRVEFGGEVAESLAAPGGVAEVIGLAVALVVLVFAFGSVIAAGLPVLAAVIGLGVGMSGVLLAATFTEVSTSAPMVAAMVGIGVGIDYALLLVSRVRDNLRAGATPVDAVARACESAGQAILLAGLVVVVSLTGLRFGGLPVFESFGWATSLVVATVVCTSLTLVPALCAIAGRRLLGRKPAPAAPKVSAFARSVTARPVPWLLAGLLIALAVAAPTLTMRTWPHDAGTFSPATTARQAYDLTAAEFGPGANSPLTLVTNTAAVSDPQAVAARVADVPGVAVVHPTVVSADGALAVTVLEPEWGPADERTTDLVDHLRTEMLPSGAELTGLEAIFVDIADKLSVRLWVVIGFVVTMSLLLLTAMLRSVVIPIKAAVANLLSVAAAYGVLVAVFQWGWGAPILGLPHAVPVSTWVPILLFAVLFGLSMDYEVFLISRIKEAYERTRSAACEATDTTDTRRAVLEGLASSRRVIVSAALIMIAVFVSFALSGDVTVKMIGLGLAAAVLVDATLIRLIVVPAAMVLLGKANWWFPRFGRVSA